MRSRDWKTWGGERVSADAMSDIFAADELARPDTMEDLLERQLDQIREMLGVHTAAILLLDDSGQFLLATAARGLEDEVRQGSRVPVGIGFAGRVAAERRPILLDRVTPDTVVNPLLLQHRLASMLGVPLLRVQPDGTEQVLGVLHVGSLTARSFDDADVAALQRATRSVVSVIVRHRAVVDRMAAAALQNSLTPHLPVITGLRMGARYVPGSQYGVGGDWYDVFPLPSGLVGIAIGDVMGHGLQAATVMGRARSALRAYALEHDDPATVLDRLDRIMQHFEPGLIGTVGYAVLNPQTGRLDLSSAGHLRPVITEPASPARLVPVPIDLPIGVSRERPRRTYTTRLDPGALLCLYTDGLVERREADIEEQIELLCRTLGDSSAASCELLCAEVMRVMLRDRDLRDDVSLLVIARSAATASS